MTAYRVTLWQGSFIVHADSIDEARNDAMMTVVEDRSWFELEAIEDPDGALTTDDSEASSPESSPDVE